jgi:hypothetical protein
LFLPNPFLDSNFLSHHNQNRRTVVRPRYPQRSSRVCSKLPRALLTRHKEPLRALGTSKPSIVMFSHRSRSFTFVIKAFSLPPPQSRPDDGGLAAIRL